MSNGIARFSRLALQGSKIDDSLWKSMGSGHHAHEFQPQTNWALEISPEKCLRTCLLWRRVRRRVTRKSSALEDPVKLVTSCAGTDLKKWA